LVNLSSSSFLSFLSQPNQPDLRSTVSDPDFLKRIGEETAGEFAHLLKSGQIKEHELIFRLARRLKGLPGADEVGFQAMRAALEAFCARLYAYAIGDKTDFSETDVCYVEFVDRWHKVKKPEKSWILQLAYERAKIEPITIDLPDLSADVTLLASLAKHLKKLNGEPFLLPVENIAKLLGKSPQHISNLLSHLIRYEVVAIVKDYDHAKREARLYKLGKSFLLKGCPKCGGNDGFQPTKNGPDENWFVCREHGKKWRAKR
jgi:hypothetical protein